MCTNGPELCGPVIIQFLGVEGERYSLVIGEKRFVTK